jgi:hypothetical protein
LSLRVSAERTESIGAIGRDVEYRLHLANARLAARLVSLGLAFPEKEVGQLSGEQAQSRAVNLGHIPIPAFATLHDQSANDSA